jgi:hypothetical protein
MIAICDHNSAENATSFMSAGSERGLTVLPGMEITSKEEIHLLALFDRSEDCMALQEFIYHYLPGENVEEVFGCQTIVNERDETVGTNRRMLIGATLLLSDCFQGGLLEWIASHIDRQALASSASFIQRGSPRWLEILPEHQRRSQRRFHSYQRFSLFDFPDPHQDIGKLLLPLRKRPLRRVSWPSSSKKDEGRGVEKGFPERTGWRESLFIYWTLLRMPSRRRLGRLRSLSKKNPERIGW